MVSEDDGLAHLEGQDETHAAAVFGHVGETLAAPDETAFADRLARNQDASSANSRGTRPR